MAPPNLSAEHEFDATRAPTPMSLNPHGDLLPLPVQRRSGSRPSRGTARRRRRHFGLDRHIDEACTAINALNAARAGRPLDLRCRPPDGPALAPNHKRTRQHLGRTIRAHGPPPPPREQAGALRELLKSRDVYDLDRDTTRRPFNFDKVRVVRDGVNPIPLESVCGPHALPAAISPYELILKSDAEVADLRPEDHVEPYTDPALQEPGELRRLVDKLHETRFLTFRRVCRSKVGIFTVAKKDGLLRLIFDCRPANVLHREPFRSELSAANAYTNLDWSDEALQPTSARPAQLCFSALDLTDAFYQHGWERMSSWFCIDLRVRAHEFNVTEVLNGLTGELEAVDPMDWVWPALAVLPMGWAWSLWFVHHALCDAMVASEMKRCQEPRAAVEPRLLRDRHPCPRLRAGAPTLAQYVDNAILHCWDEQDGRESFASLKAELHRRGFATRDEVVASRTIEAVGLLLDGEKRVIYNKPSRVWRLYHAGHQLIRQGHCTGEVMRVLTGHILHAFQLRRCAMASLGEVFVFIEKNLKVDTPMPTRVINELTVAFGILHLVCHDAGRPLSNVVYVSDASQPGYALHSTRVERTEVAPLAACRERWRFQEAAPRRQSLPEHAQNATNATPHDIAPEFNEWLDSELDEKASALKPSSSRERPRGRPSRPFVEARDLLSELPDVLTEIGRWRRLVVGAWVYPDKTHNKECRASILGPRWAARSPGEWHSVTPSLGDI